MSKVLIRRKFYRALGIAAVAAIAGVFPVRAATVDFETAGDYANNFRRLSTTGSGSMTQGNGYVTLAGSNSATDAYDTTSADGTTKSTFTVTQGSVLTVSADVRFATATSSFGFYIVDPTDESKGYLALFNVDQPNTGTADLIRFTSTGSPSTGGAANLNTGKSGSGAALNAWTTITATYTLDAGNHPVLTLSAGGLSDSITYTGITGLSEVEIATRFSPQGSGSANFDNFTVTVAAPEPGTMAVLGIAALPLLRRPRRRA